MNNDIMHEIVPIIKVVVVGDGGVGKTTLIYKLMGNEKLVTMTPGISIENIQLRLSADKIADVVFWDLGGQPQFRFFQKDFFECANIVFLVFDLNRYSSFKKLESEWIPLINETKITDTATLILIGNKIDLGQTINDEEITKFAERYNMRFFKISAKDGTNIKDLMNYVSCIVQSCYS